jgi:hypothetical protein
MAVKPADFKSAASTDFATPALRALCSVKVHEVFSPCMLIMHQMPRRPTETADPAVPPFHQLGTEIALAERHALLQRVLIYPASVRRNVVKQSLHGVSDMLIAAELRISLTDVHAIMEAFTGFSEDQAP